MVQFGALIADAEDRSHDARYLLPQGEDEMAALLRAEVATARAALGALPLCLNGAVGDLASGLAMARAWRAAGGDLFELNCHGTYRRLVERGRLQAMALPGNRGELMAWLGEFCGLGMPVVVKFDARAEGVDLEGLLDDVSGVEGLFGVHLNVRGADAGRDRGPDLELVRRARPHVRGVLLCSGYVRKPRHLRELTDAGADCVGVAQGVLDDPGLIARLAADGLAPGHYGPEPRCIPELIAHHAERAPESHAILAPAHKPLTYGRLWSHVQYVVGVLNAMGVERGDCVAQVMPDGAPAAVSYLAIASGATCFPMDPGLPAADLAWRLGFAEAKAVVLQEGAEGCMPAVAAELGLTTLRLRPDEGGPAGIAVFAGDCPSPAREPVFARPDDVALIIATSGTTDRPKLAPLSHLNVMAAAGDRNRGLELTPADRNMCVVPMFHAGGLLSVILGALVRGGSVACPGRFDARLFFEWLDEMRPTYYGCVPTMQLDILGRAAEHREIIERSRLRFALSWGSPIAPDTVDRLSEALGVPVIVSYGMTECGPRLTQVPLPPAPAKPGSVGVSNSVDLRIVDAEGNALPPGKEGELLVRGPNVMAGYLKDPEANAEAFVDGWFRTGDLGYLDEDGYLFLTGRAKELINCGGLKVAPAEVEAVLCSHPSVSAAAVFAMADGRLGEQVGAAVVLEKGRTATADELERFAGERLAGYKVPRRIAFLDGMPQTPTKKVQRLEAARAAARALGTGATVQGGGAPGIPEDQYELGLRAVWSRLLGRRTIGLHESFFDLGGDSAAAARMLAQVEATLGVRLRPAAFYGNPTIAGLAATIRDDAAAGRLQTVVPVKPSGSRLPLFFVVAAGPWLTADLARHMAPEQPLYAVHPLGAVDPDSPEFDLDKLVAHYVESVRAIQPKGPYLLGGVSAGGRMAYEMAGRMIADGDEVALVVMLDAMCRRPLLPTFWGVHAIAQRLIRFLKGSRRPGTGGDDIFGSAALPGSEGWAGRRAAAPSHWRSLRRHVQRLVAAHRRALRGRKPRPLAVRLAYFWSEGTSILTLWDPRRGWEKLAKGGFELHKVPGYHHMAMIEPNVAVFAGGLDACLRDGQEAAEQDGRPAEGRLPSGEAGAAPPRGT